MSHVILNMSSCYGPKLPSVGPQPTRVHQSAVQKEKIRVLDMLGGSVWFLMPASPSWRVSRITKIDRQVWRRHEGLSTVCILNVARLHALNRYVRPDFCSAQISHRGKLKRSLARTFPLVLSHEKLNTLRELLRSFLPGWEWRDCADTCGISGR